MTPTNSLGINGKINILHVEDDPADCLLLKYTLEKLPQSSQFEIQNADSLDAAKALVGNNAIDLILLDLELPDSQGLDTVQQMLAYAPTNALIVLTGHNDEGTAIDAVKYGAQDYLIKGNYTKDLMLRSIAYALERKSGEQELLKLAKYDHLTQLPNRACFNDYLAQAISRGLRHDTNVALLFIDMDHFKWINDSYGHHVGDRFLSSVARQIQNSVRNTDFVARIGGDEFVVVIEYGYANFSEPMAVAIKILDSFQKPVFLTDAEKLKPECSIGIATMKSEGSTVTTDDLVLRADLAMYAAKKEGGNRIHFYDPQLEDESRRRASLVQGLNAALDDSKYQLDYQSIHAADSGNVTGFEAFLRWQVSEETVIEAGQFIDVLEQTNLVVDVGSWTLQTATEQLMQWRELGVVGESTWVSVNISNKHFQDEKIIRSVRAALKKSKLPASLLHLEVKESLLLNDDEATIQTFNKLKELGVCITIDNFGTGFSSMCYLKYLPIDHIKIGQSFIKDCKDNSADRVITKAIVRLTHQLGKGIIAEGIESKSSAQLLVLSGCDYLQGYYFSSPARADNINIILN